MKKEKEITIPFLNPFHCDRSTIYHFGWKSRNNYRPRLTRNKNKRTTKEKESAVFQANSVTYLSNSLPSLAIKTCWVNVA